MTLHFTGSLSTLLLVLFYSTLSANGDVLVSSARGLARGFHVDLGSNSSSLFHGQADVFLGIPYAQPPVGELRFKLPRPICHYDGEIEAKAYKPRCPQKGQADVSEDCLFLNVFTPSASSTTPYPVMVFIHGGALASESAHKYAWKGAVRNLVSRGVVVVTLQYRLSVLGFFTTFTSAFPANRGIYDIMTALQWVQEEIDHFGGDPNQVTVFGQSAGAAAISALSLSPIARGLFHRIIQESGSISMETDVPDFARGDPHKQTAQMICGMSEDEWYNGTDLVPTLIDCFNNKTLAELTQFDLTSETGWSVSRDGALLPSHPSLLAPSRPPFPSLIGDTQDEYAVWMDGVRTQNVSSYGPSSIANLLPRYVKYANATVAPVLASAMVASFAGALDPNDHLEWAKAVSRAYTGLMISGFSRRDVNWIRDANGTESLFLYSWNYSSPVCRELSVEGCRPVFHTSELCFVWFFADQWEAAEAAGRVTDEDLAVADNMGKAWTDFAKGGSPGWEAAAETLRYIEIDEGMDNVKEGWRDDDDGIFNQVFVEQLGDFPPVTVSSEEDAQLRSEGEEILAEWQRVKGICTGTSTTISTTDQ